MFCILSRRLITVFLTFGIFVIANIAAASEQVGIILLHGKGSYDHSDKPIGSLRDALVDAGYLTELPTLPWERSRRYDATVEQAFDEIDSAAARLKQKGATRIIVAGQSMGGGIGISYVARRNTASDLIVIAPGHVPDSPLWRKRFASDVIKAKGMISSGRGHEFGTFGDRNQGKNSSLSVRADVYLSYFDPDGSAAMRKSAAQLRPGTNVLWIVEEHRVKNFSAKSFDSIPSSVNAEYSVIDSSHRDAPENSIGAVIAWLKKLP